MSFTHSLLTGQQQVLAKLMPDDLRIRRAEELQQNFLKILIGRFSLREEILATDRAKIFPSNPCLLYTSYRLRRYGSGYNLRGGKGFHASGIPILYT